MNAIEIEAAVSEQASKPFDSDEFAYDFLRAFGNKEATIKRLKSSATNNPDVGGVLQTNNIHIAVAERAHQMRAMRIGRRPTLIMPRASSENSPFLPTGLTDAHRTVASETFALYDAPLWSLALIASRLHLVWIGTVCGKLKTDFRYANTLGWNTLPIPKLTEKNMADLTGCAEDILLAREVHFPATITDLYEPGQMPENLRHAHERNDEVLERIYIGRRFKNDTERLEKLIALYTGMTLGNGPSAAKGKINAIAVEDEPEEYA